MFLQRSAVAAARRVAPAALARRTFTTTFVRRDANEKKDTPAPSNIPSLLEGYKTIDQIKTADDLLPPGAKPGTVPTDAEQATGLERLEILGKMQGVDIFDMRPLDASRLGTMEDPITVNSAGDEQYVGCTGFPVDSHGVLWITLTREEPKSRCMECGSVYKMHYVGPASDPHGHDDHHHVENKHPKPKNMADFLKPEYLEL
ncbi:COX5B-domain-containing protein [Dothidotthia symphoricarpi CBS 119687]|uniref:Cytochrome c oxidase subunit 4, mitochondrial n=1 Tax=Dothidotthia symphoricarpi CBS 119687 TaxID=1392245 RepID=A0A6A5ZX67_9PLEO|nr:COX5B-domain-containing protein [Dothidotthia symphoricarpi CBS 119687]KAF2124352.1 COX5B-domain-containing protein [Dothidotthia symphoricarpi CBS 119687]